MTQRDDESSSENSESAPGISSGESPTDEQQARGGPPEQQQQWPGRDSEMRPEADHGEQSYEGGNRVNCVAPGPVWPPLIPATREADKVDEFGADTFWGRPAQPVDIAPSYVFLASSDARFYTGEIFAPTGRATTTR